MTPQDGLYLIGIITCQGLHGTPQESALLKREGIPLAQILHMATDAGQIDFGLNGLRALNVGVLCATVTA